MRQTMAVYPVILLEIESLRVFDLLFTRENFVLVQNIVERVFCAEICSLSTNLTQGSLKWMATFTDNLFASFIKLHKMINML